MATAMTSGLGREATGPEAGHGSVRAALLVEQVRLLYAQSPLALIGTLGNTLVLAAVEWTVVPHAVIVGWVAAMVLATGLRAELTRRFERAVLGPDNARIWARRCLIGIGLSGVGWGAGGVALFPGESLGHQVFVGFVLAGVTAGAVAVHSAMLRAFLLLGIPACLPFAMRALWEGDVIHLGMGALAILFVALMALVARNTAHATLESLRLRYDNLQLIEQLSRRTDELEAANKELESFSYSVSHDLRAPLRHLDGFSELLLRQYGALLDDRGQRYVKSLGSAGKRMGQLVDDLLMFTRTGRAPLHRTTLDLGRLVGEAQQAVRPACEDRHITWVIGPLPAVRADENLIRQALIELLDNAVKYTSPRGSARIEIGSEPGRAGEAVLFVRDNGVGFDMQYAHKLFGVFQRLHSEHDFEGTGIGLANVRRIIARHGGRTWAEGKVGEGATFYVSLPIAS